MPCKNTEEVCQLCQQKTISCKHLEDVCEKCLEKVETSTEEEEEEEEEYSPPPLTVVKKRNRILWDLSFLAAYGASWIIFTKYCSILAVDLFDSILETISRPTK